MRKGRGVRVKGGGVGGRGSRTEWGRDGVGCGRKGGWGGEGKGGGGGDGGSGEGGREREGDGRGERVRDGGGRAQPKPFA